MIGVILAAMLLAQARLAVLLDHVANVCTAKRTALTLAASVVIPSLADLGSSSIVARMGVTVLELAPLALGAIITSIFATVV